MCFARYFPVYPIWFCGLALKSKLRGPALPRKRKILMISLQSQPTLVGWANKAEAHVVVSVFRKRVGPVANIRADGVGFPRTTPDDMGQTRRRAERVGFLSCAYIVIIPVVTQFLHISAHVIYAKCVRCFLSYLMGSFSAFRISSYIAWTCCSCIVVITVPAYRIKTSVAYWIVACFSCSMGSAKGIVPLGCNWVASTGCLFPFCLCS